MNSKSQLDKFKEAARALETDDAEGEAGQDRCESCQPWPVRHISIGRGCSHKKLVPENLEPD